jgi:hypothetical protein
VSILTFGTFWFWAIFVVAFILMLIATEKGSGFGATSTLLVTIALLFFLGNKVPLGTFFSYSASHAWQFVGFVLMYLICGVGWAVLKWYFLLIKIKDKYIEEKRRNVVPPEVGIYKSQILVWMFYWPFSSIWTLMDVPVKRFYHFIYKRISGILQNMSNKIFQPLANVNVNPSEQQPRPFNESRARYLREIGND